MNNLRAVGQKNQGARAYGLGFVQHVPMAINWGMQVLVNQLRYLFPESPESNAICNYSTVLRPYGK